MTTTERMSDLIKALKRLKENFNVSDLERAIDLAEDIHKEIDAMEREMEGLKKAA